MTDEEITELVLTSAAQASGICTALMTAFRALQSQPSYEHTAFTSNLAALQVAMENYQWPSPAVKTAFVDTLDQLARPPQGQLPWAQPKAGNSK